MFYRVSAIVDMINTMRNLIINFIWLLLDLYIKEHVLICFLVFYSESKNVLNWSDSVRDENKLIARDTLTLAVVNGMDMNALAQMGNKQDANTYSVPII